MNVGTMLPPLTEVLAPVPTCVPQRSNSVYLQLLGSVSGNPFHSSAYPLLLSFLLCTGANPRRDYNPKRPATLCVEEGSASLDAPVRCFL